MYIGCSISPPLNKFSVYMHVYCTVVCSPQHSCVQWQSMGKKQLQMMLAWRKTQVDSGDQQDGAGADAAGGGSRGSYLANGGRGGNENFWVFLSCTARSLLLLITVYLIDEPFQTTLPHQPSFHTFLYSYLLCTLSFHVSVLYLSSLMRTYRNILLSVLSTITPIDLLHDKVNFGALFSTSYEHLNDLLRTLINTV